VSDATLARARAGDERAFHDLVEPHRRELLVHCYRMLGSLQDAEDVAQETLFAAWRGLSGFAERASLRTWLYRIATNRCLNALRDASRRPPVAPVPPFAPPEPTRLGDTTWLEPCPDALLVGLPDATPGPEARYEARESIELAFLARLQRLPARQRAVLVLRDVLGFRVDETAAILRTSEGSVKGALQRARAALDDGSIAAPDDGSTAAVARMQSRSERDVARRFADAIEADDIDGVVALLTDDAWLTMPPAPHEYQGAAAIAAFLRASAAARGGRGFRLVPTGANLQPAYACYLPDLRTQVEHAAGLIVLTVDRGRISHVTRFLDNALFDRFELPPLPDATSADSAS
jgi:RNA polymerase sigma-70 factor (ECF subfamily)